jgi:hypothetical protein
VPEIADRYTGQYVLLHMGEVVWSDPTGYLPISRRELARRNKDQGLWLKFVDPEESEGEHYEVYEHTLHEGG